MHKKYTKCFHYSDILSEKMDSPEKQMIIQQSRCQIPVLDNLLFISFYFATSLPKETQLFYASCTFSSSRSTLDVRK